MVLFDYKESFFHRNVIRFPREQNKTILQTDPFFKGINSKIRRNFQIRHIECIFAVKTNCKGLNQIGAGATITRVHNRTLRTRFQSFILTCRDVIVRPEGEGSIPVRQYEHTKHAFTDQKHVKGI